MWSSEALPRRGALTAAAALVAAAVLPGCGFELRRTPVLPFARIAIAGFAPRSPMERALQARLAGLAAQVPAAEAQVVLTVLEDRDERVTLASTAAGQVRELRLAVRLAFRLDTPQGQGLIAPTLLRLSRDLSWSETLALAKAQEEAELLAALREDIADQLLQRLAGAPVAR